MSSTIRLRAILAVAIFLSASPLLVAQVKLESETAKAFDRYISVVEREVGDRESGRRTFLGLDDLVADGRHKAQQGRIVIKHLNEEVPVPNGLVHDWGGAAFIPDGKIEDVVTVLRDYDNHQDYYDEVVDSKIVKRDGDRYHAYLRFEKRVVFHVILNTEHDVEFRKVSDNQWTVRSRSTRIAQVENPGETPEKELPVENDNGFLWRMNSYWSIEESDGGVYMELGTITLTRAIPAGLEWLVRPYVQRIPRNLLENMLHSTRIVVKERAGK